MNVKVLSFSLDNSLLNRPSALAGRVIEYGGLVLKYTVIVPSPKNEKIQLSEKVKAYGSGGRNKLAQLIKIYLAANKLLRQEKYDIITVQDQYYLALLGWLMAKKFKLGMEIQIHGWEKYGGWRKYLAQFMIPRADAIRAVSQRLKRQIIKEFGVSPEKITVVPIYVDLRMSNVPGLALRSGAGECLIKKDSRKFIFLTVGRLVAVKNIALQIKAMADIVKKHTRAQLWIAGDGGERKNLEILSRRLYLEKNIKFYGWQKNVADFYGQADVFLLTSNAEGWPLVIIESASYALPIIMTDMGSAGEFIKDGENGIVVEVGNGAALAKAMFNLIENEELRRRLGEKARAAALNLPLKEEIFKLYQESWHKALKR